MARKGPRPFACPSIHRGACGWFRGRGALGVGEAWDGPTPPLPPPPPPLPPRRPPIDRIPPPLPGEGGLGRRSDRARPSSVAETAVLQSGFVAEIHCESRRFSRGNAFKPRSNRGQKGARRAWPKPRFFAAGAAILQGSDAERARGRGRSDSAFARGRAAERQSVTRLDRFLASLTSSPR